MLDLRARALDRRALRRVLVAVLSCLSFISLGTIASSELAAQERPFIGVRYDADRNRVLLEIAPDRLDRDFLYQTVLATGGGVGALGLDRGQTGGSAVLRFERRGRRILVRRDNLSVRAIGGDEGAQRAAREAFPYSVIANLPIESEANGAIVVDATSIFLADTYGIADGIRRAQGGNGRVDANRSWVDTARTKAFPNNTEVHAVLTFAVDNPGASIRRAAPDATSPVFELHHSLVALPSSEGFRPRVGDARAGLAGGGYNDFAQGFDGDYRAGHINRWRLIPRDPVAYARGQLTEPVNPIIYYLDPGVPEPYRTAFLEGGNWWGKVFEAAGFRNGFQVRPLPPGVDPMDSRYNLIYWVHRAGPGPSVGPSMSDPRTGEIVRTVVRMDSWRSLVDYNIYAGLLPAAGPAGLNVPADSFVRMRRRQHVAHEIGHTIGFPHNYIAHAQGRSSVMDYPFPVISVDARGNLDLRQAYAPFAGGWDSLTVRYAYTWYPDARSEAAGLDRIVKDMLARDLRYVGDQHAGADGSIPEVTRWVEGRTSFDALERTSAVRRLAIDRFNESAIKTGEPMYLLNMRFTHVYLHHRYSLEGIYKNIGGMDFRYAMRGDGQTPTTIVPAAAQRRALGLALDALEPAALAVPDRVQAMIPPMPPGGDPQFVWAGSAGGTAFDEISLAGGLATEVIEGLMERERLGRVVLFRARSADNPSLDEILQGIVDRTWGAAPVADGHLQSLRRVVQRVVLNTLLDRAGDRAALPDVRQVSELHLEKLDARIAGMTGGSPADQALRAAARREIARFFAGDDDPTTRSRHPVLPLPWP